MWAQLIKMTVRPEREQDLPGLLEQLHAAEQPDSGLVRTMAMRDQNDPSKLYTFVLFESEEKARAREQDPRREEALKSVRAAMAEMFDGPPEFVNLTVVQDA
ncbi:MAG: antibiotic biosynthesis monooxygenase [Pseudonocardiales bacterium]